MSGQLAPTNVFRSWDNNGLPLVGGQLFTYTAGTSTPQATYTDSTLGTPNTNPVILNFRGEAFVWLDPTLTYKFVLTDALNNLIWTEDNIQGGFTPSAVVTSLIPTPTNTLTLGSVSKSWANAYFGPSNVPVFDPVSGNIGYYARTAAEIAAGVTPTNYSYPPGYVDRYGINTTPGTTNMAAAFSASAQVAGKQGCSVRWGATAPYLLGAPVNCTGIRGVVFNDESSGNASNSSTSLIIGHTGHGFDLATSTELTFNNVTVKTAAATVPKSIWFAARNAAGSGAGIHRFNNCRTDSAITASWIYYGYGSEENRWYGCYFFNNQAGSGIISHNGSNPAAFSSTFVTIATGNQSNTEHRHYGCNYFQFGNSGSQNEVVFNLELCSNFTMRDGLWLNSHGLAYVSVSGTQAANDLTFDSIRGEQGAAQPLYGVAATYSGGGTCVAWTFTDVVFDCSQECVHFITGQIIQGLVTRNTRSTSGKLIAPYSMSNSFIESVNGQSIVGISGGTVTQNIFAGQRVNINLSASLSATANIYFDNNLGAVGIDSDSFTSASTACTGALTVSVQYTVRLMPNGKTVVLSLPATVGTATAVASFTYGVVLPVQFRPAANLRAPCIIEDNGGTLNQQGFLFINASTGALTIFKDIVGTATFTAAAGAGLPGLTEFTWNL